MMKNYRTINVNVDIDNIDVDIPIEDIPIIEIMENLHASEILDFVNKDDVIKFFDLETKEDIDNPLELKRRLCDIFECGYHVSIEELLTKISDKLSQKK